MTIKELIRKTARGRDIKLHGCIGFNRSAEALEAMGDKVLPDIEDFLVHEFLSEVPADRLPGHPWVGLPYVFDVYFKLGADSSRVNVGQFLLSLHGWLREERYELFLLSGGH